MQQEIIAKLIATRKERKWTRYQLAKETGLSQTVLSRIEKGQFLPSMKTLLKITDTLGLQLKLIDKTSDKQNDVPC